MSKLPTLLFGLGATKCGTSWLYRYLCAHPQCHMRTIKELHYFNALDRDERVRRLRALREQRALIVGKQAVGQKTSARRLNDIDAWSHVVAGGGEAEYLDYLMQGQDGAARLVGDITPAYALLPSEQLERMARLAPDVRFVYLMRDPVERLWSHARMIARRRSENGRDIARRARAIVDRVLQGGEHHIAARGDYAAALARFDAALAPARLLVMFYEELFTPKAVERLCAFLGLRTYRADFSKRVHGGASAELSGAQRAEAAGYLAPQYNIVAARMGRLPEVWEANMVGV